ncbi:MAG: tetratricopeptide repeat protein [Planctomycetes bacterium]|nr:tetratricopeptide repeat protein [Planctomycetota bacterium]
MDYVFREIEFARELAEGGDLDGAIEILRPLTGAEGEIGQEARYAVAYCYHAAGESGRALALAGELAERYPLCPEAQLLFGGIASDVGDYKASERALRRARTLDPGSGLIYFHLGLLHHRMGRHRTALRDLRRARSLGHDPGETEALCGEILFDLERYEEAIRTFETARRHAPERLDLLVEMSAARAEINDLDGAWEDCISALRRDADFGPAYLQMASIRERQGQRDEARALLRNAIQLQPDAAEPYLQLAQTHLAAGTDAEAAEILDACHRNVAEEARGEEYVFLRALLLERTAGRDAALGCLRDFLRSQPAQSWDLLSLYRRLAGQRCGEVPIWQVRIDGKLPDPSRGLRGFRRSLWIAAPTVEEAIGQVRELLDPLVPARFTVTCRVSSRAALRELGPYQCGEYQPTPEARSAASGGQRIASTTRGGHAR